jgi:Ca2+-binding EF-hand superfamily protein
MKMGIGMSLFILIISRLEKKELRDFFQLKTNAQDEELLIEMINQADKNNDGIISVGEFRNVMEGFYEKLIDE